MKLIDGLNIIRTKFAHEGYLEARVDPQPVFDDARGRVTYRMRVTQGPQYHMGQLIFAGGTDAEIARVRKMWKLQAGAVYDSLYPAEFTKQVNAERALAPPRRLSVQVRPNRPQQTVDVVLTIQ